MKKKLNQARRLEGTLFTDGKTEKMDRKNATNTGVEKGKKRLEREAGRQATAKRMEQRGALLLENVAAEKKDNPKQPFTVVSLSHLFKPIGDDVTSGEYSAFTCVWFTPRSAH